ncbi:hypothetical protein [uncultured Roseobacter sp.]|uniref:hypothetical protein n=1 Tax=uncultured Roseobacter sp. TaxID=114847 RepID=UPI00261FFE74|nr:hypothetical protein [uncultured Roseobacter sp.]
MLLLRYALILVAVLGSGTPLWSDTVSAQNGSDTFFSGSVVSETIDTRGDTFLSARSAIARGVSQGDLHITGMDVSVQADTAEDLYAFGGTVLIRSAVARDLTAGGFSVRTESSSETSGNARIFGNSVTIEGKVEGALLIAARDVILNAPIEGDARILAKTISFGPNAVVGGTLTYSTRERLSVPERVAPTERVVFERAVDRDVWKEWSEMRKDMPVLPTFASLLSAFVISLLFFVVLGTLMLTFMPKRLEKMHQSIATAPGQTMLLGIIGLSILFGMVPITGLTLVGLPFVPIAVLGIIVTWTLGYALGAYSVAMRIWTGFGGDQDPGNVARLLVFAVAIIFVALLNFIPFFGWVANYTLVLLGIGAMTHAVFQYLIGNPGQAFDIDMKPIED